MYMAIQKPSSSFRVRAELKEAIENAFYDNEKGNRELKSVSAFMEQLMEIVWSQYQIAGSLSELRALSEKVVVRPYHSQTSSSEVNTDKTEKAVGKQVRTGQSIYEQQTKQQKPEETKHKTHRSQKA